MYILLRTIEMIRAILLASNLKAKRNKIDVLSDRIRKAATEPTMALCIEQLCSVMDAGSGDIAEDTTNNFLRVIGNDDAPMVLRWLRLHPRLAAMIAGIQDDKQRAECAESIPLDEEKVSGCIVMPRASYDVGVTVTCLSPLVHGDDRKAGNSTLFRRMDALTTDGRVDALPYYAANALRGQMRDLLADHFLRSLGLSARRDRPVIEQWFFQSIYSGGTLEERGAKSSKRVGKLLGNNGALRTDGFRMLRDMLPALSLLGTALGNKIIPGRLQIADLRPRCIQWGTGVLDVSDLMTWTFLTRRDDREVRDPNEDHSGMIANAECMKAGVVMDGGIDYDRHIQPVELAALGRGLILLQERGKIGAENRRGMGEVEIEFRDVPDSELYDSFLADRKDEVLQFLREFGALIEES